MNLTQNILQEMYEYNSQTGGLYYKCQRQIGRPIQVGQRAGTVNKKGYRILKINGKTHKEHRLVWMYHHGQFPEYQIDHMNNNKDDNRIENLREATNAENSQNRKIIKGVYLTKKGKWHARIGLNGKRISIGYYDNENDAINAYLEAKKKYHPFFVSS